MQQAEIEIFVSLFYLVAKSRQDRGNEVGISRGKPEYLGKNLSEQSREPTNLLHI